DSLIPAGDAVALQLAMQRVLDDPQSAAAEMRGRLTYIAEAFSLAQMAGAIEALYLALSSKS
ncbi:MAG: hypothetical protein ABI414_08330, partial [Devosia sp.]